MPVWAERAPGWPIGATGPIASGIRFTLEMGQMLGCLEPQSRSFVGYRHDTSWRSFQDLRPAKSVRWNVRWNVRSSEVPSGHLQLCHASSSEKNMR